MKKIIWVPLLLAVLLTGCRPTASKTVSKSEKAMEISYSPIVCKYSVQPGWGSVIDCISTNIQINDDNTVTISYGDFWDPTNYISLDYIYGETFEITEEQKQSVITAIQKNKIYKIDDCGDINSCDGGYSYIYLFNADGEEVHSCGGYNPHIEQFENTRTAIATVLPENALRDTKDKATEILIQYLLDHYPEHYEWLKDTQ